MYFRRTMSSEWVYEGDRERKVLLRESGSLAEPCSLGLSGLPLDDCLSSPNNGSCDSGPRGRCISGLSAMSISSSVASGRGSAWEPKCTPLPYWRSARNSSFMGCGKEVRRKGLAGRTEGLLAPA